MLRALQLLFAAVVTFASWPVFAAFSLGAGYPQREGGMNRPVMLTQPNPLTQPNAGFNRADCLDTEQTVRVFLNDVPVEATDVEIWASRDNTSCADPANRPGGANVQCWKVARWTRDQIVNKVVTFKPLQLIQAIDKQTNVDTAEALEPAAVCAKDAHMLPALTYLQIMAFNSGAVVGWSSGGGTAGAVIAVPTAYDLAGPNPPTAVSAAPTTGGLDVSFDATTQPPADFDGYNVYCFPGPADGGCPAHPLVPGKVPSADLEQYICASGTTTSGKLMVTSLSSDSSYAVAIAARDQAGNAGKLSEVSCGAPVAAPTDDMVTSGCSCRVGAPRSGSFGIAALGFLVAIALRRRRSSEGAGRAHQR